eukprot:SAG11_NODE_36595_length_260_cov_4.664596_1_plen_22_part_01
MDSGSLYIENSVLKYECRQQEL